MKTVQEVKEQVMCADINLDNLAKTVPGLDAHPFFKVVKYQLQCAMADNDADVPDLEADTVKGYNSHSHKICEFVNGRCVLCGDEE